jgi:hypothetical protein
MGFVVHPNPHSRLMKLDFWGLWDTPTMDAYRTEVLAGIREMSEAPHLVLANARRFIPQRPEVQTRQRELMALHFSSGLVRVASVLDSAVSKMQIKRLFEEAGSPPETRFLTDEKEARDWLAELEPRTRWSSGFDR